MMALKRDDVLAAIAAHRGDLERLGVATLALFGSVARDEATAESNIDLLVRFREPETFRTYAEVATFLEDLLNRPVDLVIQSNLRSHAARSAAADTCYVPGLSPVPE